MAKFGNGYDAEAAKKERENAEYARLAREAESKQDMEHFFPTKTRRPSVYRKGEAVEGTAKVGQLKGKDLEALKARLAKRFKK